MVGIVAGAPQMNRRDLLMAGAAAALVTAETSPALAAAQPTTHPDPNQSNH
jgi:uncharacterized protein (DUF1501 family)